jgi:Nucleotidyl transferase AbiEii toxin, Type IV TA system
VDNFSKLSPQDRRPYFEQAASNIGLNNPQVIEKDFWVCWSLRRLFGLEAFRAHLTFKGGTSLSKAFRLIERFSEDIDLILDRSFLGFGSENDPERAGSKGQRKKKIELLKKACSEKIINEIAPALKISFAEIIGAEAAANLSLRDEEDGVPSIVFPYPSSWANQSEGYVSRIVKIEIGARSDDWPSKKMTISPYVAQQFPTDFELADCELLVLAAERTFCEKATLLHEECCRPSEKAIPPRLSRHYSDLSRLRAQKVAAAALKDKNLLERVIEHRQVFFNRGWVDYATMSRPTFRLVPPDTRLNEWRQDYEQMREMFFGSVQPFEDLMADMKNLEAEIRAS